MRYDIISVGIIIRRIFESWNLNQYSPTKYLNKEEKIHYIYWNHYIK